MISYRYDIMEYLDYQSAKPGQWFIGVISTDPLAVYVVPVNIFEQHNNFNRNTLENRGPRTMNRYASGAPGEREGRMSYFWTYIEGNWLANRPIGQTHHTAVMYRHALSEEHSYGFSLIKINNAFAQMKMVSNSLNTKPDSRKSRSFSQMTYYNKRGEHLGMNLLPKEIELKLVEALNSYPYSIPHIAVSLD